jgi:hypothetical protein
MGYLRDIIEGIIIGLIIVVVAIIIFVMIGQYVNDYPKASTILDINSLQSGDLLSVSYNNQLGTFVSFWSRSFSSHPALVYRRSDTEIFIVEGAHYDGTKWKHVIVIPIKEWLEHNKKYLVAITKFKGPRITNDQMERGIAKISHLKLQSFKLSWIRFIQKSKPYTPPRENRYVCYEILMILLQELGIVKKLYSVSNNWPGDFCWGRLELEDGYSYEYPKLLNY